MYCVNYMRKLCESQLHILIRLSSISKQHVYLEASSSLFSVSQNVTLSSEFLLLPVWLFWPDQLPVQHPFIGVDSTNLV
jgi:hypothetical protein